MDSPLGFYVRHFQLQEKNTHQWKHSNLLDMWVHLP
jgi:hypothetical protein